MKIYNKKKILFNQNNKINLLDYKQENNLIYLDLNNLYKKYYIKKNISNIISGKDIEIYIENKILNNYIYLLENNQTKTLFINIKLNYDLNLNIIEIINLFEIKSEVVGILNDNLSEIEIINFYYILGKKKINKEIFGIHLFYDNYINFNNTRNYNKLLFLMCNAYKLGLDNKLEKDIYNYIINLSKEVNFHKKNCILISKLIRNYGGCQKTSIQLIELLDKYFNIIIFSSNYKEKLEKFNFKKDYLNLEINNSLILNNKENLIEIINNSDFVIINKYDDIFKFIDKLTIKPYFIVHNSNDPINNKLIKYKNKFENILTINQFNKNLLINFGVSNVDIYRNYFDYKYKKIEKRKEFTNKICFVGRFSEEKNIQLLIDAFNEFCKINTKVFLYLIGNGINLNITNNRIINLGKLEKNILIEFLYNCDYLISSSKTEGKPFTIVEAFNVGLPVIHSNINGINEMIFNGINGFLFNFENYDKVKYNLNFDFSFKSEKDKNNIINILEKAYKITIDEWNKLSDNCYNLRNEFDKDYVFNKNYEILNLKENKIKINKKKIFCNFKFNDNIAYGGGNISVYYLVKYLNLNHKDFDITFELEKNINIYLIIDVLKDNNFKKYSIEEIINHKNKYNIDAKIIIRVNDCDKTRIIKSNNQSRENIILSNINNFDYFVFNSNFIKDYYLEKLKNNNIFINNYTVITNGCDENIFTNKEKILNSSDKIKIVTHHWSNNLNKGYETYYKLWKYSLNEKNNIEFIFIGKNVPDMFKEVPILGPFIKEELSNELNKCHIYITDSKYDSCPNHVIEAISCGLPILYSNCEGGARELCQMSEEPIGEIYNNFDELIEKINKIKSNYEFYLNNNKKYNYLYKINYSISKYYNVFMKNIINKSEIINLKYDNNIINIHCNNDDSFILLDNNNIKLIKGNNLFSVNNNTFKKIELFSNNKNIILIDEFKNNKNKLNNNKINVLICSDENYYVGLFAVLNSVIVNTDYLDNTNFNFIIPINCNNFSLLLKEFEIKKNINLNKNIIYIDDNIIDENILKTKCFNGGGHLLNIGNFSRLLIGEFLQYDKLIYLDSDSIVQNDIIKKLMFFNLENDLYSPLANLENKNNEKRIVIKMDSIINCNYNWEKLIQNKINKNDYVFMGAPFITNCKKWDNIYTKIIEIIKIHNNEKEGLYKLFTMSLQNILFYKKSSNINCILNVLQDLGSQRKKWEITDLNDKDILDWSGIYKPWFINGLYKNLWNHHNIMNLAKNIIINTKKNICENLNEKKNISYNFIDFQYLKINDDNIKKDYEKYIFNLFNFEKTNFKYNILYVCDSNYLLRKMSRVRFWAMEELSKNKNVKLTLLGPGFTNFDSNLSLQENILNLKINFDLVIWYKPLNKNYNFNNKISLPFKTCLRYNEMWDENWTQFEINETKSDIIICHHYNDYLRYKNELYKNDKTKEFYYNPHHADPKIFKNLNIKKEYDILLSGVSKEKHYPLKYRLFNLINKHKLTTLKKYNIYNHQHPGYNNDLSFKNINQISYNEIINKSKICIACTSKYNYRLGKYVEIPMSGSIILGDLPFEDNEYKNFIIEVNMKMTDKEILNKIIYFLENKNLLEEKTNLGIKWAKKYETKNYVDNLLNIINNKYKIFIISDEIRENHPEFKNQKWICDILKQEFMEKFPLNTTTNAKNANIIWYLAPWNYRFIPNNFNDKEWFQFLKQKKVIFTQHHIDEEKLKIGQLDKQFEFMKTYGNKLHAICELTKKNMLKFFDKKLISSKRLWINQNNFYYISNKIELRKKYNFNKNSFLIGSFQKDTEGKTNLPKLSKGPDIFINIVIDMYKNNPQIEIVLTGLRREYIINELNKYGIKYHYFNMTSIEQINELYNCLDLYIISSRCEGGPRSVFEAGLTKTPIISTRVGIAPELIARSSLFDYNNWITYKQAKPNTDLLFNNILKLSNDNYLNEFYNYLIN